MVDPHGINETHQPDEHREDWDDWELDPIDAGNDWIWFGGYLLLTGLLGICLFFAVSWLVSLGS